MTQRNPNFSFIVLTFNDEMHIGRLLSSIQALNADTFILDSGSTDLTLTICAAYNAIYSHHPFENHPKQWDEALRRFDIQTPWIIALDADQIVSAELVALLAAFSNQQVRQYDGIYFNRKNYHRGRWIKHGGYYPFYMLKMFRHNTGVSDLNENMDHRFIVPGKTLIWKQGYLIEKNLKEHSIQFWLDKHGRYSELLAQEEVERMMLIRSQATLPKFFGSPNERKAFYKMLWWKLPRYVRPCLYFSYRFILQRGFLDGRTGIIFHFLQGFWFRLIVDLKIDELLEIKKQESLMEMEDKNLSTNENSTFKRSKRFGEAQSFFLNFLTLFLVFYSFNILFIAVSSPGGMYIKWLDENLNYIQHWRTYDLQTTATILNNYGYQAKVTAFSLSVDGYSGFKLVYSCLGYGIMSFYAAFVIAYPKGIMSRLTMLSLGLIGIQALNLMRFSLISIYWKSTYANSWINHHAVFNLVIYILILLSILWWTKTKFNTNTNASNKFKEEFQ